MHELSIVMSIIEIAEKQLVLAGGKEIEEIELEIGELSGIEMQSFDFAWEQATKNTSLDKAERIIDHIQGQGKCADCHSEFTMHNVYDACPNCNGHLINTIRGKELRVKSLIVN